MTSLPQGDLSFLGAEIGQMHNLVFAEPIRSVEADFPSMAIAGDNSAIAVIPPASINTQVLGGVLESDEKERKEIIEHVVSKGETFALIAEKYSISVQTILWANELSSSSKIKSGQKLIIPPITGVLYHVGKGDTLSEIAGTYKGKLDEVISFNGLLNENDIFVGDILMIPNGKMPSKPKSSYTSAQVPLGSSYFICPHTACKITQGLHYYNAIDFGGQCGDPIYVAAAGTVEKVAFGWNGGGGNYVRIAHPNGVSTYYGHVQTALVSAGQKVSQGDMIALTGGKPGTKGAGISTGCHVHFDVRGAKNPFAK
ncbi:MAG: M23 family metallopeptidase [bacterium]|nr:M23 family metallopeptidase [bacterium]